jgi:DNA-directed RNA polymerase specialized sigma24 family protein
MRLETLLALGQLPEREREALIDRRVLDAPLSVVAARLGVSDVRAGQLVRAAEERMARILRRDDV